MLKAERLFHPDCPGTRVFVVRGFWGRLFKPANFATLGECLESAARRAAQEEQP